MRITLLTEKYPPDVGGLAVSARRLACLLAGAGHVVRVLAPSSNLAPGQTAVVPETTAVDSAAPVTARRLGASRRSEDTLADWYEAVVTGQRQAPSDLLVAYYVVTAGFVAVYAGRTLGLPAIVSARGNDLDRAVFDPGKAGHVLYALANADAVTANSSDLVRKAQALASGQTVTRVPNGVDTGLFCPASPDSVLRASLGLGDLPVIGFVGEARAKKGLATLLLAFRDVAGRRPAALLLVGGVRDGDDAALLAVFRKQNPTLPVVTVPYLDATQLPTYYALIDVLVMPSLHDGLPNALLEGMACSCAVVGSTAGGIPDALADGENGLLVPPGDASACAAAIEELLADPGRREVLGQEARATVLRDFTLQQELDASLTVFQSVSGA